MNGEVRFADQKQLNTNTKRGQHNTHQHLSELLKQFELAFNLGSEYTVEELEVFRTELRRLMINIESI
jgi:hypothetical protein